MAFRLPERIFLLALAAARPHLPAPAACVRRDLVEIDVEITVSHASLGEVYLI